MVVQFFPSQLAPGDDLASGVNASSGGVVWTGNVWYLLWADICTIARLWAIAPRVVMPMWALNTTDELYLSPPNIFAIVLHSILIVIQTSFLGTLFALLVLPIPLPPLGWSLGLLAGFLITNHVVCLLINGRHPTTDPSEEVFEKYRHAHPDEFWIYLNGVSVGACWLQANVDRLSKLFGRRVLGVHNPTAGIVFDLIECLVQRNFNYATSDVREAYKQLRPRLLNPKIKKVVFILHSQGAIEGGMIVDWLLAELPSAALQKLEVYTFGNAANHFNNPIRHESPLKSAVGSPNHAARTDSVHDENKDHPDSTFESPAVPRRSANKAKPGAIGHIEHYANTGDFVAQFGVLNFYHRGDVRFAGRVFMSPQSGGHLLNQHYLHHMFPLNNNGDGASEDNPFMDTEVAPPDDWDIARADAVGAGGLGILQHRETLPGSAIYAAGPSRVFVDDNTDNADSPVVPRTDSMWAHTHKYTIGDFSRLWQYRNGCSPEERA